MNEELEKQLATILEKALNVAEQTGEFVLEQAPQLLQEFYMWHTAKYILGVIAGIALIIIARVVINFWSKKYDEAEGVDWDECKMFGRVGDQFGMIVPYVIITFVGLTVFCINTYNLIFITVAPKLYLIEYFMK